jgi:hypothetical protein
MSETGAGRRVVIGHDSGRTLLILQESISPTVYNPAFDSRKSVLLYYVITRIFAY